jgi:hypothetical protein
MAKHFSEADLLEIVRLKDEEGLTHKEIAVKLGRLDTKGQPNDRAIMKQYKRAKSQGLTPLPSPTIEVLEVEEVQNKALNEMSRRERTAHLRSVLPDSPKGKFLYEEVLDDVEREMFEDEYFRILSEEDSFTAAEEGILFMAMVHWTLAMRAMKRDKDTYNRSAQAGYTGQDQLMYTDQWTREYHENMKKYESLMKSLKLSREQRLKDVQRMGTTFLDYAERVARSNEQEKMAEEIMKLEGASEAEFKKLQENGWMLGGGMPNNSPTQYEAVNEPSAQEQVEAHEAAEAESVD